MQITVSLVKIENIYRLFGFGDDKKKKNKTNLLQRPRNVK